MELAIRIKELRKVLNITQQAFADRLGLKRNTIATYEIGNAEPSDRTISDICREFNVDEVWLRTGKGEMFIQLSPQEQLLDYVASIVKDKDAKLQRTIINFMSQLPKELWDEVEKKSKEILESKKPDAE